MLQRKQVVGSPLLLYAYYFYICINYLKNLLVIKEIKQTCD